MYSKQALVPVIFACCILGCNLFSNKTDNAELVFAATEVGTPEGQSVTKNMGPDGGSLSSPDGRFTLTVPHNALTETIPFSIQPITNKADGGLGLAYRLEPDGATFTTPLQISVRYDDRDIDGTVPEALSIAYQDEKGGWRMQKSAKLDETAKTLTFLTTHFTDFAFLARLRMNPIEAKVFVGESEYVGLVECPEQGFIDKILSRPINCKSPLKNIAKWDLRGQGTIEKNEFGTGVKYTAPSKKPTPNHAFVMLDVEFEVWDPASGAVTKVSKSFASKITIIDNGYRATGKTADVTYSGVVCSLYEPFTVNGSSPLNAFPFKFTPTSANEGKVSLGAVAPGIRMEGSGTYKVENPDSDNPRLAITMSSIGHTPIGSRSGGGTFFIDLVRLETGECDMQ